MDTLIARQSQRAAQRAVNAPNTPYENGGRFYQFSASVNFDSMASGASNTKDIAVPSGLVLPVGQPVIVGTPDALAAGITLAGKVKTGGAAVSVTATNSSGSTNDPGAMTVIVQVAKG